MAFENSFYIPKNNLRLISKEKYYRIIDFYMTETPIERLSSRSVTLNLYGWKKFDGKVKPDDYRTLGRVLFDNPKPKIILKFCKSKKDLVQLLENNNLGRDFTEKEKFKEKVVFYNSEPNRTLSLFFHIRNSIAHGRYVFLERGKTVWYAFEDYSKNGISARGLLKVKTLLNWIDIIKKGPQL